jgi:hypothetical protein
MTTREKTVVLLSTQLDVTTALNVVGHLSLGLGAACRHRLIRSNSYTDASGERHLGVSAWPFVVLKTRPAKLRSALDQARRSSQLVVADYPREILTTTTDDELAAALAASRDSDLEYLGLIAHGPVDDVDAVFGTFSLVRHEESAKI